VRKFFNTAGPCVAGEHFLITPERRFGALRALVEQRLYFILHAPRQMGKTTLLNNLAVALNREGTYSAVVTNVEFLERWTDVEKGNLALVEGLARDAHHQVPEAERAPSTEPFMRSPLRALQDFLSTWSAKNPKPIVLLIDEIDSLAEDLLISVLRQLRGGYTSRSHSPFIHSLALVGLRDIRDHRVKIRKDKETLGTASPFNVKTDSLTLHNFTREEVAELYLKHTEETGQVFEPNAMARAYYWTQGQPWLVNALARQITEHDVPDRAQPITVAHVNAAKETLIQRRDTHLDSLANKLHEPRVKRVIEPILAGATMGMDAMNDDLMYCRDLGLIAPNPPVRIANPIYQEVIPRTLTFVMQYNISDEGDWYTLEDGSLDMMALLRAFQRFFRRHADAWLERYHYKEAGPQLILMAFLQRIVNGGGDIEREFAVGSGRADLVVRWGAHSHAIELKLWDGPHVIEEGLEQLGRYLDRLGESEGYLVVFDRREGRTWEEKLFEKTLEGPGGQVIHLFGV